MAQSGRAAALRDRLRALQAEAAAVTVEIEAIGASAAPDNGRRDDYEEKNTSSSAVDVVPGALVALDASATGRYSRLLALERMNIVPRYSLIREKTIAVVGIGGVGGVVVDMLTRAGVGSLVLVDRDVVEVANMNRMFFTPEQVGQPKVDVAAAMLRSMNPDVLVQPVMCDISLVRSVDTFTRAVLHGHHITAGPVDLILSCVDNYAARITINRMALEHGLTWMESGVSEDAVNGHIQTLIPGCTACFECAPPLAVASGMDERDIHRDGACAASLPTVMGVIAGMLAHNALKYLLGFGSVAYYQAYASLVNYAPSEILRPNPACVVARCVTRQRTVADGGGWHPPAAVRPHDDAPLHADNEWGITVQPEEHGGSSPAAHTPAVTTTYAESTGAPHVMDAGALSLEELEAALAAV